MRFFMFVGLFQMLQYSQYGNSHNTFRLVQLFTSTRKNLHNDRLALLDVSSL